MRCRPARVRSRPERCASRPLTATVHIVGVQTATAEQIARVCPPFRWRLTSWLASSPLATGDVAGELRGSLFNRMTSLVTSALMIFSLSLLIAGRHPTRPMLAWPVLDGAASLLRLAIVAAIVRHRRRHSGEAAPGNSLPDWYVLSGLLWCATLGYGTGLCLASGDGAIATLGGVMAMATMAAQCGRVPGAPRIVIAQFVLIGLPVCAGAACAPDRFMACLDALAPAYLLAMASINAQLHRDFVELMATRLESRQQALRCALTGLPNRRLFDRTLARLLSGRKGPESPAELHVFCLDLDGFKAVNDTLGHPVGDLLLQQVAQRLQRQVPEGAMLARIGGDEFAVVAQLPGAARAEAVAQQMIGCLRPSFALSGGNVVQIGVSVGIASTQAGDRTAEALLGAADQAMYRAKRSGRNRLQWCENAADHQPAPPRPTPADWHARPEAPAAARTG